MIIFDKGDVVLVIVSKLVVKVSLFIFYAKFLGKIYEVFVS